MQRIQHVKHCRSLYPGHLEVELERGGLPTARAENIREGAAMLYNSTRCPASDAVQRVALCIRDVRGPQSLA